MRQFILGLGAFALLAVGFAFGMFTEHERMTVYPWNDRLVRMTCYDHNAVRHEYIGRVFNVGDDGARTPLLTAVWPYDPVSPTKGGGDSQVNIDLRQIPLGCMFEGLSQEEILQRDHMYRWHRA